MNRYFAVIIISITVVLLIVANIGLVQYAAIKQERDFDSKLSFLQREVADLHQTLNRLTSATSSSVLPAAEIDNRQLLRDRGEGDKVARAAERIVPALISIVPTANLDSFQVAARPPFGTDPFYRQFPLLLSVFERRSGRVTPAAGTLISEAGHILTTKQSAPDPAAAYTVLMASGVQADARVVYQDSELDFALLKLTSSSTVPAARIGQSKNLKTGQGILALGNPGTGSHHTIAVGTIYSLGSQTTASAATSSPLIETTAASPSGNIGGPLVDLNGEIIGLNLSAAGAATRAVALPIDIITAKISRFLSLP